MDVLSNKGKQKGIASMVFAWLTIGGLVFGLLLILTASRLHDTTGTLTGSIGPVHLFQMSRQLLSDGSIQGDVRLDQNGLAVYLMFLAISAVVVHIVHVKSYK